MESQPPQPFVPEASPSEPVPTRDPDLVALEGFESDFAELEAELEAVERRGGAAGSGAAGGGAGATAS